MKKKNIFYVMLACMMCFVFVLIGCGGTAGDNAGNGNDGTETYYTVDFDSCGGSAVESQRILEGNTVKNPAAPKRENYSFIGWYKASDENAEEWKFTTDRVTCDITLYAKWQSSEVQTPTENLVYERNDNGFTVVGANGQDERITIPAEHDGLPVTEIGESAFAYSKHTSDITYVSIPDSVTVIGLNAFHNRSELVTVDLSGTSKLTTIGRNAFSGNGSLKTIYIPQSVIEIGDAAFNNCGSIESISVATQNTVYSGEGNSLIEKETNTLIRGSNNSIIPSTVTTIMAVAFRKANGITELNIPVSVVTIGNYFIADSTIIKINYAGTEEQWNAIEKSASMWNYGNRDVQVAFASKPEPPMVDAKVLVAYFSATNMTKGVAEKIAVSTGGNLYSITPAVPYTSADLNYNTDCRANREQNNPTARPEISGSVKNMEQYSIVFIGYPIWWGQAPKIIYTFLESYDFSGKTIIPFCTSASSGMGSSATNLSGLTMGATWKDGRRFSSSATQSQVDDWIESENYIVREEITEMYLTINGNKIEVTLAENSSVDALVEILKHGDITYTANDYGGFEKVGGLGHTLPTNNSQITTQPGDVILYSGNQIVIFYGNNSWSYTRLGKINGYSVSELRTLLDAGNGSVQVTISLN